MRRRTGGGGGNAAALYNQGVILWNQQKYAEAKDKFEAATKADPKHSEAQYRLGMSYVNLGDMPKAVTAFEGYLAIDAERAPRRGSEAVHQRDEEVVIDDESDRIAANLLAVRRRLEQAARMAGRDPSSIRLVAVSKTFPPAAVRAAARAGQVDFGENKVQEGLQKIAETPDLRLRWHLIGHLQSNKARRAAAGFHAVHSIDGLDLLRRVDTAAGEAGTTPELLVQVDLAGEETKFGCRRRMCRGCSGRISARRAWSG